MYIIVLIKLIMYYCYLLNLKIYDIYNIFVAYQALIHCWNYFNICMNNIIAIWILELNISINNLVTIILKS